MHVACESAEGARAMQAFKFSVFGQKYELLKKKQRPHVSFNIVAPSVRLETRRGRRERVVDGESGRWPRLVDGREW